MKVPCQPPLIKTSGTGSETTTFRQPPSYITVELRFYDTECHRLCNKDSKSFQVVNSPAILRQFLFEPSKRNTHNEKNEILGKGPSRSLTDTH